MTREQKTAVIKDTVERISKSTGMYLANFSGLSVEQANKLRGEFHKIGVDYKVVKNTLLKRALEEVGGYEDMYEYLVNQTGVVISYDDPIQPARVLETFLKENGDKPEIKVCVVERQVFDGSRLKEVASLPTRDDLIANIIGSIGAPAHGIVMCIHNVMANIVYAIDAIEKQKAEAA